MQNMIQWYLNLQFTQIVSTIKARIGRLLPLWEVQKMKRPTKSFSYSLIENGFKELSRSRKLKDKSFLELSKNLKKGAQNKLKIGCYGKHCYCLLDCFSKYQFKWKHLGKVNDKHLFLYVRSNYANKLHTFVKHSLLNSINYAKCGLSLGAPGTFKGS